VNAADSKESIIISGNLTFIVAAASAGVRFAKLYVDAAITNSVIEMAETHASPSV
jgi:hypothetical protein